MSGNARFQMELGDKARELDRRKDELARLRRLRDAANELVAAMDYTIGPSWRAETLNQGEDGDEVNQAWDHLMAALEGVQT